MSLLLEEMYQKWGVRNDQAGQDVCEGGGCSSGDVGLVRKGGEAGERPSRTVWLEEER